MDVYRALRSDHGRPDGCVPDNGAVERYVSASRRLRSWKKTANELRNSRRDTVTLTRQDGEPIASGRMQLGYSSKVGAGETSRQVAQRLIWRHYRATKSGTDFNRPLTYRNYGVV
jgi:hypothetical protein